MPTRSEGPQEELKEMCEATETPVMDAVYHARLKGDTERIITTSYTIRYRSAGAHT